MAGFLKRFFGKDEPEKPFSIEYTEISLWLDQQEIMVHSVLNADTEESRATITGSLEDLRDKISILRKVEIHDDMPPKLRRVVETALPAFTTAMEMALRTQLSDDPGEFYDEIVIVVRSCTKHMRGQGKYVAAAFPDDMKEIKTRFSTIGREINSMTGAISQAQKKLGSIHDTRDAYDALTRTIEEHAAKREQWESKWKLVEQDENKLKEIDQRIASIESDEGYVALLQEQEELNALERERDDLVAQYASTASTLSGVLRRAEHVAVDDGNTSTAGTIGDFRRSIDNPDPVQTDEIVQGWNDIFRLISGMVTEGRITLKNKEEERLFSEKEIFQTMITQLSKRSRELSESIEFGRLRIERSEKLKTREELRKKHERIKQKHTDEVMQFREYEKSLDRLKAQVPGQIDTLRVKMGLLIENDVNIEFEDVKLPE